MELFNTGGIHLFVPSDGPVSHMPFCHYCGMTAEHKAVIAGDEPEAVHFAGDEAEDALYAWKEEQA